MKYNPEKSEGDNLRIQSIMMCKDPIFQRFCFDKAPDNIVITEDMAKQHLCGVVGIKSRSEITKDVAAQQRFKELSTNFVNWKKDQGYADNLDRMEAPDASSI